MRLLLDAQKNFDLRAFDRPEWQIDDWRGQKTRHIGLHVAKAAMKVVNGHAPTIASEVVPDLSIYRAQLINTHELPVDVATEPTLRRASDNDSARHLIMASGHLAYYLEPAEHGVTDDGVRLQCVMVAAQQLHVAVESLGHIHHVDIEAAHQARLEQLLADHPSI